MRANPPAFKSIREFHDALDRKQTSVLELTQSYLEVSRANAHNAYITLCEQRALGQAREADLELSRAGNVPREQKPLFGVPFAVKDNLVIDGVHTTGGSRILEGYVPPYSATAVVRLEAAGAISLGKANLDEFSMGGSNENSAYGPVLHPTHPDRVPGGSSGGSASAVGAGLCLAALGSDTGGSIRLPASYCGVVGLKPTYGRVSRYGLLAFASSLDQVGPLTHTVEDAAAIFDAISGHDPRDSTSSSRPPSQCLSALAKSASSHGSNGGLVGLRIGVPKEYEAGQLSPDVERAIQGSLRWMESQGARLVPISLPHSRYAIAIYYLIATSEASSNLSRYDGVRFGKRPPEASEAGDLATFYKRVRAQFGPEVKRRIILGTFALSAGYAEAYYLKACQARQLIRKDFDEAFKQVDLIAGPVASTTAFKLGEKSGDPLQMYLNDLFTIPANLAGLPAVSISCGADSQGLPIGLQMMGPHFGEDRLLSAAFSFEKGRA